MTTLALRKNERYMDGELECVLSLAPTEKNIRHLSKLLRRSEEAIRIIYRKAFGYGRFASTASSQRKKILAAKRRVGIAIGRTSW